MDGGIEGVRVSGVPAHPQVRTKLPTPFQRPRIDLDGGTGRQVRREWRTVLANRIGEGDTVAGFGTIYEVTEILNLPGRGERVPDDPWTVTLTNMLGERRVLRGSEPVFVFTAADGEGS